MTALTKLAYTVYGEPPCADIFEGGNDAPIIARANDIIVALLGQLAEKDAYIETLVTAIKKTSSQLFRKKLADAHNTLSEAVGHYSDCSWWDCGECNCGGRA